MASYPRITIEGASKMSEGEFVRKLLKELNSRENTKAVKINTGSYGRSGEPDIMGSHCGLFFAIEVKLGYNIPTALQRKRLAEWADAGATTGVITHYEGIDIAATITELIRAALAGKNYEQKREG